MTLTAQQRDVLVEALGVAIADAEHHAEWGAGPPG